MIEAKTLMERLGSIGFELFAGLPCSYLTPLINRTIADPRFDYVGVANEGDGVAVAGGAQLGGKLSVVMFQNSGLGNAVSPLTSLTATFQIPVLILVTWRGQPNGPVDEPQHTLMGSITPRLLELMEIGWEKLPGDLASLEGTLERVSSAMRARRPYALVIEKGSISGDASRAKPARMEQAEAYDPLPEASPAFDPDDVLQAIQAGVGRRDAVLATTGFTGRALYALEDRPNQFYMVGSMGCISSLGLGLAKAQPTRRVVAVDGDGALLMRMGALATIGHERPENLIHVVLDNGVHDSTGAQTTVSSSVDLPALARSCGYARVRSVTEVGNLKEILQSDNGPTFVHVRTRPRVNRKLPRPELSPRQVGDRFRAWLAESDS